MTQEPKIFPYIVRLLQGAEVVWKPLGEVAEYEQPTKYLVKSSNYKDIYLTPVLTAGKTFILGYTDETEGIYKASISPVIIFDDFTTANKWVDFDFKAKSSAMKMITSKNEKEVLLKYIYYWLNTLPSELIEGDHKRQWISNYANKKIPLPPHADRLPRRIRRQPRSQNARQRQRRQHGVRTRLRQRQSRRHCYLQSY